MFALRSHGVAGLSVAADVEVGALLGGDGGHGVQVHLVVHKDDVPCTGYLESVGC